MFSSASALNTTTISMDQQSVVWKWIASLGPPQKSCSKPRPSKQSRGGVQKHPKQKRNPLAPVNTNIGRQRPGKVRAPTTTPPLQLPDMRLRIGKPRDDCLKSTRPRDILKRYNSNTCDIFQSGSSPTIKQQRMGHQFVIETPETFQHHSSRSGDNHRRCVQVGTFTASNVNPNRCDINFLLN